MVCKGGAVNQGPVIKFLFSLFHDWSFAQPSEARKMLNTVIISCAIIAAFGLLFFGLFMHFGRDWNGK